MQNCSVEYECGMCKIPEAAHVVVLFCGSTVLAAQYMYFHKIKLQHKTLKQP